MAKNLAVRVDDRLIHGQVVTQWIRVFKAQKIVVIDNNVATNKMQKSVLKFAAPSDVTVCIYSVDKAVEQWNKNKFGNKNVFVLFRDVLQIGELKDKGVQFPEITLGQMAITGDRKQIYKQVGFSEEEAAMLWRLQTEGTDFSFQMQPTDKKESLDIMKKTFPGLA